MNCTSFFTLDLDENKENRGKLEKMLTNKWNLGDHKEFQDIHQRQRSIA